MRLKIDAVPADVIQHISTFIDKKEAVSFAQTSKTLFYKNTRIDLSDQSNIVLLCKLSNLLRSTTRLPLPTWGLVTSRKCSITEFLIQARIAMELNKQESFFQEIVKKIASENTLIQDRNNLNLDILKSISLFSIVLLGIYSPPVRFFIKLPFYCVINYAFGMNLLSKIANDIPYSYTHNEYRKDIYVAEKQLAKVEAAKKSLFPLLNELMPFLNQKFQTSYEKEKRATNESEIVPTETKTLMR